MTEAAAPRTLVVLGSTGSIGTSTLDVVSRHPQRFRIHALVAAKSADKLAEQAMQFNPRFVALLDPLAIAHWHSRYSHLPCTLLTTLDEVVALCGDEESDTVVAAIVGAAGLEPTLAAVKAGKHVLLANKESLVLAGHLMMEAAQRSGAVLLPVDSEHNAIFQSLPAHFDRSKADTYGIRSICLTASGGPFLKKPLSEFASITPEQAVAHPNWSMGHKISVDSATMANKGLELIEAYWLFGLGLDKLKVIIHPQSIVHSMVNYDDGGFVAQLGVPDMRTPIAHCLAWPDRIESGVPSLDFAKLSGLTFFDLEFERYPALKLAYDALATAQSLTAVFNAANEVAVQAFLERRIGFLHIAETIRHVMDRSGVVHIDSLAAALEVDRRARELAVEHIRSQ